MSNPAILIVEDESIVAEQLADAVRSQGYQVIGISSSGRNAIELAKNRCPDVILMDVRLEGDLNGIETAIVIQGHFDQTIPVVFLTALPGSNFPVLTAVEPYIYVNKPIREEDLFDAIQRALSNK